MEVFGTKDQEQTHSKILLVIGNAVQQSDPKYHL